jgi:hypothetical protein
MAKKYMLKLMMVEMELIIFIVFEVKANAFMSFSLHPSSLPINFPHSSQLDNIPGPLQNCLEIKPKVCNEKHSHESIDYADCVIKSFMECLSKHHGHLASTPPEIIIYSNAKKCLTLCFCEANGINIQMENCLLKCYEDNIKQ